MSNFLVPLTLSAMYDNASSKHTELGICTLKFMHTHMMISCSSSYVHYGLITCTSSVLSIEIQLLMCLNNSLVVDMYNMIVEVSVASNPCMSNSVVPLTLSTMFECLLLAISYIAESVTGTREYWTQLHRLLTTLISTFIFDPCIHEQTIIQTHQELNLNNNFFIRFHCCWD